MSVPAPHQPVIRVARRRAKPGCAAAYEALVGGMLGDVRQVPGFIGAGGTRYAVWNTSVVSA